MLIIITVIILLSVLVLGPLFLMAGARVLRIPEVRFRQALTVNLLLAAAGLVFIPVGMLLAKLGIGTNVVNVLYFLLLLPIGIWLIKKKFATSYPRSAGVYLIGTACSILLAVMISVLVVQSFIIPPKVVSMEPSILPGDMVFVNKYIYRFKDPQRGELAVFLAPVEGSNSHVKRLIALPGEQIEIRGGVILIDGKPMEPAIVRVGSTELAPLTVPAGSYYVMGENLAHSYDSRHYGAIPRDKFLGRLELVIWSRNPNNNNIRWNRFLKEVD